MKALSIRAPWWWFILNSGKNIENRDWPTRYRGRVMIHASKWYVHGEVVDDLWWAERVCGIVPPKDHPYEYLKPNGGKIVGSVEICDCVTESDSPWFQGKYGFVLRNPICLPQSIPFKGSLGLFEVPESLIGDAA